MSEGVWLDQIPHEPDLVGCIECGDPLQPQEVMITYVGGKPVIPLCRQCFDRMTPKTADTRNMPGNAR